jgi:hypothetical protein
VEVGNPADTTLAIKMMGRQKKLFGDAPKQASFDGGFATRSNLVAIRTRERRETKAIGVGRSFDKGTQLPKDTARWPPGAHAGSAAGVMDELLFRKATIHDLDFVAAA